MTRRGSLTMLLAFRNFIGITTDSSRVATAERRSKEKGKKGHVTLERLAGASERESI